MSYIFEPPQLTSLTIIGESDRFPVRRVYNVARNYRKHVIEMGGDPATVKPAYFLKPRDAIVECPAEIPYPMGTNDCHHEIELVVALSEGGKNVAPEDVETMIYGYAVGLDLTRRDLQAIAKKKAAPWDTGKAFDNSAPISHIRKAEDIGHPKRGPIWLNVNGEQRQMGDISDLIVNVKDLISDLSKLFELKAGDLMFTGTPEGVGPILPGDHLEGGIEGVGELSLKIT